MNCSAIYGFSWFVRFPTKPYLFRHIFARFTCNVRIFLRWLSSSLLFASYSLLASVLVQLSFSLCENANEQLTSNCIESNKVYSFIKATISFSFHLKLIHLNWFAAARQRRLLCAPSQEILAKQLINFFLTL